MGHKKSWLPFALTVNGMRLNGKERLRAEAQYTLDGEDLDRRLLEIDFNGVLTPIEERDFKIKKLVLDLKWGKVSQLEHDLAVAALMHSSKKSKEYKQAVLEIRHEHGEIETVDYETALAELQYKDKESPEYRIAVANIRRNHEEITEREYNKEIATIRNEPWVEIIEAKVDYNSETGNSFSFELDWNQAFVEDLIRHGYTGPSQADIVDEWFTQTCQDVFNLDPDFQLAEDAAPTASTTRRKIDGNSTEFS